MEVAVLLNFIRFLASFFALIFATAPMYLTILIFISTIFYSFFISFTKASCLSTIAHKCISHVPSTILLVLASYYDNGFRPIFLIAGAIQYLNIWLQMYSEVFTKELRNQVIAKKSPHVAEEGSWILSDVNFI